MLEKPYLVEPPISILTTFLDASPRKPRDSGPCQVSPNFRNSKVLGGLKLHPLTLLAGLPPSHCEVAMLLATLICRARLYFPEPFPQEPQTGRKSVIQSQFGGSSAEKQSHTPSTHHLSSTTWMGARPHRACVAHRAIWYAHSKAGQ